MPLLEPAGEVVKWFGIVNDISARREAELALRALSDTLECEVPEGDVLYVVGRDVTGEREHAAALRLHENILKSDRLPICAFDTDYRLIAFNRAHNDEFRRANGFDTKLGDVFSGPVRSRATAHHANVDGARPHG